MLYYILYLLIILSQSIHVINIYLVSAYVVKGIVWQDIANQMHKTCWVLELVL